MNIHTQNDCNYFYYNNNIIKDFTIKPVFERYIDLYPIYGTYYRIPFIIKAPNNDIIVGSEGRWGTSSDFQRSYIVIKRSNDNGKTFSAPQIILNNNSIFLNFDHGSRCVCCNPVVKGNRIYLFVSKIDDETTMSYYGSVLSAPDWFSYFGYIYSDDNGVTWSAYQDLSLLKTAETNLLAPCPTSGIVTENGTIVIPVIDHRHSPNTADVGADWGIRTGIVYSTDDGVTWNLSNEIDAFTDESCIIEYEPNKLMVISRSLNNWFRCYVTDDFGNTWNKHINDKKIVGVNCQVAGLKYLYNGIERFFYTTPLSNVPNRSNIWLKISKDCITWYDCFQIWGFVYSNGYTAMITNSVNGFLYFVLETTGGIILINLSCYKDYIINKI